MSNVTVAIDSTCVTSYSTPVVSVTIFETLNVQFDDLELERFKVIQC